MRTTLRVGTTALGAIVAASLAYLSFGAVGCTVTVNDAPDADAAPADTYVPPTDSPVDTTPPPTDTPVGFGVIIPAKGLTTSTTDPAEVHDFKGGSTKTDILNGRIAYAVGKAGGLESTVIGKDAVDNLVDGKIVGLPNGTPVTITVTGYLRGLNGKNADAPNLRIPWATTTCTATPSATADVTATCSGPLKLLGAEIDGVVFSSDVLPSDYCAGKGASTTSGFSALRARTPESGPAVASRSGNDCLGVVFVPAADFAAAETSGVSLWRLSLESLPAATGTACTLKTPCTVDRNSADTIVVGSECQLNAGSTGNASCF